ncbi:MAG: GNAT family N-acetyltransferase [Caulobacter sp.]|nr:GNAT family N-acetyltransferase [Caulobacter sp.]
MNLRPYAPGDEAALAELWFESWSSIGLERPVVTRDALIERAPRDLAGRWEVTVAEADGRLLGFLALAPSEHRLDQLFIAPDAQGLGIGEALFEVARRRLPAGFWLATHADNGRARAFYERRGMQVERVEADPAGDRVFYRLAPPVA